jgi:hypothetical protein
MNLWLQEDCLLLRVGIYCQEKERVKREDHGTNN